VGKEEDKKINFGENGKFFKDELAFVWTAVSLSV